jgi:hypothetical protein
VQLDIVLEGLCRKRKRAEDAGMDGRDSYYAGRGSNIPTGPSQSYVNTATLAGPDVKRGPGRPR